MKQKIIKQISYWLGVIAIGLILGVSLQFVRAWTEPTAAPPGGNVGAPLNTGNLSQLKIGGLILNVGGAPNGLLVHKGNVGIGTVMPQAKLEVKGNVIADAPTAGNHLATKDYVDAASGSSGDNAAMCYVHCAANNDAQCMDGYSRVFLYGANDTDCWNRVDSPSVATISIGYNICGVCGLKNNYSNSSFFRYCTVGSCVLNGSDSGMLNAVLDETRCFAHIKNSCAICCQ